MCGDIATKNMQSDRWPRWFCLPCGNAVRCLRNQTKGDKKLAVYLRNLGRGNPDEYRMKVRSCRIIEPDAPDGTPGLRSLADRRTVIAELRDEIKISVSVSDEGSIQWPDRSEYASMKYMQGECSSVADGKKLFDQSVLEAGALVKTIGNVKRIAVPGIPVTKGAFTKERERSLVISAPIESQGALERAKSRLTFSSLGIDLGNRAFSDVAGGAFGAVAAGSHASLSKSVIERPSGTVDSDITMASLKESSLMCPVPPVTVPEAKGAAGAVGDTASLRILVWIKRAFSDVTD